MKPSKELTVDKLLRLVGVKICGRWREFSEHLHVEWHIVDSVHIQNAGIVETCFIRVADRWLAREEGTGDLPRTWDTVFNALKLTGYSYLVDDVRETMGF